MKLNRMNDRINELADKPFEYGKNDCFTFTNALVREWHGVDYRHLHRYRTKKKAEEYMADNGGIEALTTGTLGYSVDPMKCGDGDVVSANVGGGIAVGFVFDGHGLFKTAKKVAKMPLKKCSKGWKLA